MIWRYSVNHLYLNISHNQLWMKIFKYRLSKSVWHKQYNFLNFYRGQWITGFNLWKISKHQYHGWHWSLPIHIDPQIHFSISPCLIEVNQMVLGLIYQLFSSLIFRYRHHHYCTIYRTFNIFVMIHNQQTCVNPITWENTCIMLWHSWLTLTDIMMATDALAAKRKPVIINHCVDSDKTIVSHESCYVMFISYYGYKPLYMRDAGNPLVSCRNRFLPTKMFYVPPSRFQFPNFPFSLSYTPLIFLIQLHTPHTCPLALTRANQQIPIYF